MDPHFGQIFSNLTPHSPQNFVPSGLSNWHLGHSIHLLAFDLEFETNRLFFTKKYKTPREASMSLGGCLKAPS
jgi:hypothetical protein